MCSHAGCDADVVKGNSGLAHALLEHAEDWQLPYLAGALSTIKLHSRAHF